jgi:undecaprenyl-diphosphatase
MAGALLMSASMALLVQTPAVRAACAHLLPVVENVYRRVLAVPIGRGWLRP